MGGCDDTVWLDELPSDEDGEDVSDGFDGVTCEELEEDTSLDETVSSSGFCISGFFSGSVETEGGIEELYPVKPKYVYGSSRSRPNRTSKCK